MRRDIRKRLFVTIVFTILVALMVLVAYSAAGVELGVLE